jgi:hypothetical protein
MYSQNRGKVMEDSTKQKDFLEFWEELDALTSFGRERETSISKRVDEFEGRTETKFVLADGDKIFEIIIKEAK